MGGSVLEISQFSLHKPVYIASAWDWNKKEHSGVGFAVQMMGVAYADYNDHTWI